MESFHEEWLLVDEKIKEINWSEINSTKIAELELKNCFRVIKNYSKSTYTIGEPIYSEPKGFMIVKLMIYNDYKYTHWAYVDLFGKLIREYHWAD